MAKINWIIAVLIASTHVAAQQAHTPPAGRQPVVSTPSTSGVQVTPRTANSPYTSAPATMTKMKVATGNVQGYVIWDASAVQYKLSAPCQGLQVTLVDSTNNQGQTLASSSNLTPLSSTPQWNFTGGSKGPWMVCGYSFHQVPEKQVLQVRAAITQPSAFSPQAFVKQVPGANGTNLVLATGNCNNPPDSTLSTILASTSVICGGYAFNVNLEIFAPVTPARGSVPATSVKLLPNASGTNQPAPGMLLSASPPTGQQQNATSSATRGHLLQPGQGGGNAGPQQPGTISGYVFWDPDTINTTADPCPHLTATVKVGTSSGLQTFQGFTTSSLKTATFGVVAACMYSVYHLPMNQRLYLQFSVPPSAFVNAVTISNVPVNNPSFVVIQGGGQDCHPPPIFQDPAVLKSPAGSCGTLLLNVNYSITAASLMNTLGAAAPPVSRALKPGTTLPPTVTMSSQPRGGPLSGTPSAAQSQSTPGMLLGNRGQTAPASGGSNSQTYQTGGHGPTITTRDVINMLKASLPESTIISSIRSSNHQFDFSRENLQALHDAHASPAVLVAMCDGSARSCPALQGSSAPATPGSKVELNPQPFPPRVLATPSQPKSAQGSTNGGQLLSIQPVGRGVFTNTDVIALVKGGTSETTIISRIKSAQTHFDFSSAGCKSLTDGHVSGNVLLAMGAGSVMPCSARSLRPATQMVRPQ